MKKILCIWVMLFLSLLGTNTLGAGNPPGKGDLLPALSLPIPNNPEARNYLGLSGEGLFKIPHLEAQVVIIEIFSMYCPYCQKEASSVNELFQAIEDLPYLKEKIKLIGIGAGNTPFEVGIFKKTYNIPFPLFADQDFVLHKSLGEVRTPYFLAIKINKDKTHQVIYSELGSLNGAKAFLKKILILAKLKQEDRR